MTPSEEIEVLKRAYDRVPELIFMLDVLPDRQKRDRFRFILLNKKYEEIVGLKHSDITGKTPRELFNSDVGLALEIERHYQDCVDVKAAINYREGLTLAGKFSIYQTEIEPEIEGDRVVRILGLSRIIGEAAGIEKKLHAAIANNKLNLYYQPIRRLTDCKLMGYEALLRWPESGLSPDKFLPIAERANMMFALNRFVIDRAAAQIKKLSPGLWISINLSEFNVSELISEAIAREGIKRSQLEIEVLEIAHVTAAIAAEITMLNQLGHRVKIDDYGTRYSNAELLKILPCHQFKIDKKFIYLVSEDPGSQAIVRGMITVAKALGLTVVAEGIERWEDWQWLLANGCQYGQGYHPKLGKPMELN